MTNYLDQLGRPLGANGKEVENGTMYAAILIILNKFVGMFTQTWIGFYCKEEVDVYSHDNNTGAISLGLEKLNIKQLLKYLPSFYRDIPFYLMCRFPLLESDNYRNKLINILIFIPLHAMLLPMLSFFMIWTQFPHKKITPFYKRKFIQWTEKYEWTMDLPSGGKRHFYTNNKVWDEHPDSLDGKMLNICRVHRLKMKKTAKILDWVDARRFPKSMIVDGKFHITPLAAHCFLYFEKDINHPIVLSSNGKTYSSLI